jgi:hypothetical protein
MLREIPLILNLSKDPLVSDSQLLSLA